jgi:hypothetical protein
MSPNFALILLVPAWNDFPVKREKASNDHANTKRKKLYDKRKDSSSIAPKSNQSHDFAPLPRPVRTLRFSAPSAPPLRSPFLTAMHLTNTVGEGGSLRFNSSSAQFLLTLVIQSTLTLPVTYGNSR